MANEMSKVKAIVDLLVRANVAQPLHILELGKKFKKQANTSLREISSQHGFENVSDMIRSWQDFNITGSGFNTIVTIKPKESIDLSSTTDESIVESEFEVPAQAIKKKVQIVDYRDVKLIKTKREIIPSSKKIDCFDETFTVSLMDATNPHRFWFALHDEAKELDKLMTTMHEFYEKYATICKIPKEYLQEGLYVAALYNKVWHRAKILKVATEKDVRVFYVDFGSVGDVSVGEVLFLKEEFSKFPAVGRRGVLTHIQPADAKWNYESVSFFKKTLTNVKSEAKIFKYNETDSSYFMAIMVITGKEKKLVSQLLVDQEYANVDIEFMEKGKVADKEMDFSFYEKGCHLEKFKEPEEVWIPTQK